MKSPDPITLLWQMIDARDATVRRFKPPAMPAKPLVADEDAAALTARAEDAGEPGGDLHSQELEVIILRSLIPHLEHRIFLDIGAEKGELSRVFMAAGMTGHLFEPAAQHAERLQALVAGTGSLYHALAIDEHDREAQLQLATNVQGDPLPEFNSLHALSGDPRIHQAPGPTIRCRSLRSLMAEGLVPSSVGLIKTDTEGNDAAVLRGLDPSKCEALCCEFFTEGLYAGWKESAPEVIIPLARKLGFEHYIAIKHCDGLTSLTTSPAAFAPRTWGNLVFVQPRLWHRCLPVWLDLVRQNEEYIAAVFQSQVSESQMLRATCEERLAVINRLAREKHEESARMVTQLQAAHEEISRLAKAAEQRKRALENLNLEKQEATAGMLTQLQAAHEEISRVAEAAEQRKRALENLNLENETSALHQQLVSKEAALMAAHEEIKRLAEVAVQREQALLDSTAEADRMRSVAANAVGQGELERLHGELAAKERVIQDLAETCQQRMDFIDQLAATGDHSVKKNLRVAVFRVEGNLARSRRRLRRKVDAWLLQKTPYQIAKLVQHPPRPLRLERFPGGDSPGAWPRICIITPSYNQARFLGRTMNSVLGQDYPNLAYGVQDGGSTDGSAGLIEQRIAELTHAESAPDDGQSDAINKGFRRLCPGNHDIMAWLNSDDLLMPGALKFVGRYFDAHPEVDVIYGHRVIIDEEDREVGRWFMPDYHGETLRWFDLVPQETLFWRARCYEQIGGVDASFQFAMDWDLLLRFQEAGFAIQRLPYFLGCFRVHTAQKTSARIQTLGEQEMQRLRRRVHQRDVAHWEIHQQLEAEIGRSARVAALAQIGIRR